MMKSLDRDLTGLDQSRRGQAIYSWVKLEPRNIASVMMIISYFIIVGQL